MPTSLPRLALSLSLLFAAVPALADGAPAPRLITVSGTGEGKAAPNRAELSSGVVTRAVTASSALAANARAMNAVFDALKRAGIAEKNIQTSNFQVSPQYSDAKPGLTPRIAGYEVSNNVSVTVEGLDRLGPTIDALVAAGSNQIEGPEFSIADPKPLLARAREEAVKDATARAQAYAQAAGVTLGPIVSINEGGDVSNLTRSMGGMMAAAIKATPVAAGEQSVTASVSISWEIH